MGQIRDRSLHFTSEGIALIEEAMQLKGWDKNQLAEQVEISYESVCRYLRGERPPQRKNIEIIAKRLGLRPIDLVNPNAWTSSNKVSDTKASVVDWRSVSKGMLEDLKRLTTEALTAGDGIRFDFDDVFVPLGVVERQERTKRNKDDGAPDRGSELYEEKVTPITHTDFFEDVLLRGNTKNSNGKRIAVIGEAGAGKTTQLQKIGSWLLENSDDIPVWISLTDLGAKSLREYLFENWVREASGEIEAAPQAWKDLLGDAIKSGKVWLLLDGVDEMTVSNPLSYLSNQLNESWLKNVRIVLTCRVNVWDGGKNALTGFDVYRNLDFDYPDDVYKFIGKWFVRTPELAGSLTQALEQSGKERIRDMVKNPLRLTLLCYSWQLKQGELPETKAGLYEWFVEAFYKWNKDKTQIELSRSQEDQLNRALGELAKRAIDGETSRFRLTKTFIENVFREFNIDLFDIALKLNWLNEIGVAAEDSLETVYAFYHPSFQEYFAALAINDWDFFLPRDHVDRLLANKKYRIFEPQWRYCFFLWIGQEKSIAKSAKEEFLDVLWNFNDYCGRFYSRRGRCLAVEATGEFGNCDNQLSQEIIGKTLKAAFSGYKYLIEPPVVLQARSCLLEINPVQVLQIVQNLLNTEEISNTKEVREEICNHFGKYWSKNKEIVNLLLENKLEGKLFQDNCYGGNISHLLNNKLLKNLGSRFADFVVNSFVNSFFTVVGKEQKTSQYIDYTISEDEIESAYQSHLEEIQLRQEDKIIIENAKDAESLIAIFYSEPPIVYDDTLIIDRIIEDYLNSDCSNKFIVDILTSSCKDASLHESGRLYLDWNSRHIISCFNKFPAKLFSILVFQFGQYIRNLENPDQLNEYCGYYEILWQCADRMKYADFHAALHQPIPIHPEVADFIPASNTDSLRDLETQFVNLEAIQEELDRNTEHPEIRCLVIDVRHLEQESDPNVIAKKLTNKIFNSIGRRIPVVQDVSCLERELLNLKFDLGVEKLAIALYSKGANEAIHQLCQSLAPSIQIRLFTGGQTSEQLINEVKAWLRRINLEYN